LEFHNGGGLGISSSSLSCPFVSLPQDEEKALEQTCVLIRRAPGTTSWPTVDRSNAGPARCAGGFIAPAPTRIEALVGCGKFM